MGELSSKAPSLKVLVYEGCRGREQQPVSASAMAAFDVVLTTYETFQQEIHFVRAAEAAAEARPAPLGSWDTFQGPSQTRMRHAAC